MNSALSTNAAIAAARCPIHVSTYVTYGWWNLYWYKVREVGIPFLLTNGWLVPVRYGPGTKYALIHYRFGQASAFQFDRIIEVMPNMGSAAWSLQNSSEMPEIISADSDRVVLHVFDEVTMSDEGYAFHGEETRTNGSKMTLYGILGPRNDRDDTLELIK